MKYFALSAAIVITSLSQKLYMTKKYKHEYKGVCQN